MRKLPIVVTLSVLACAGLIGACDDPKSDVSTAPSTPGISSISLSGPGSVAPGQSAQFTAMLAFADGTIKAATSATNLKWRSSNPAIFQVNTSGQVTATQQRGEATLTVDWTTPARTSSKEVVVLPDGTFRVVGQVTEAGATAAIIGARVEGTPGGIVTTTDIAGQYRLYGVPSDTTIRVTSDGYLPSEKNLHLTNHAVENVQLALSGPRVVVGGQDGVPGIYTLSIDLIGACPTQRPLPAYLQHRTYAASVTQTGSQVDVLLTEPIFRLNGIGRGNRFSGRANANSVTFTLDSFYDYYYPFYGPTAYPNVAERLPDGTYFIPAGTVVAVMSATGLSGQMSNGYLTQYSSAFPSSGFLGWCSGPVQFTLTRR